VEFAIGGMQRDSPPDENVTGTKTVER